MGKMLQGWTGPAMLISLLVSLLGMILATTLIIRMPADHFTSMNARPVYRHPAVHVTWVCTRNLIGAVMIILGGAMIILPGPGLLSVLLGMSLMDLPGKRWLLLRGLRLKSVRQSLNWVRHKAGQPPLKFPC